MVRNNLATALTMAGELEAAAGAFTAGATPAVAAYNYFQRRITGLCASSEVVSSLVLAYLSAGTDPKRGPHG